MRPSSSYEMGRPSRPRSHIGSGLGTSRLRGCGAKGSLVGSASQGNVLPRPVVTENRDLRRPPSRKKNPRQSAAAGLYEHHRASNSQERERTHHPIPAAQEWAKRPPSRQKAPPGALYLHRPENQGDRNQGSDSLTGRKPSSYLQTQAPPKAQPSGTAPKELLAGQWAAQVEAASSAADRSKREAKKGPSMLSQVEGYTSTSRRPGAILQIKSNDSDDSDFWASIPGLRPPTGASQPPKTPPEVQEVPLTICSGTNGEWAKGAAEEEEDPHPASDLSEFGLLMGSSAPLPPSSLGFQGRPSSRPGSVRWSNRCGSSPAQPANGRMARPQRVQNTETYVPPATSNQLSRPQPKQRQPAVESTENLRTIGGEIIRLEEFDDLDLGSLSIFSRPPDPKEHSDPPDQPAQASTSLLSVPRKVYTPSLGPMSNILARPASSGRASRSCIRRAHCISSNGRGPLGAPTSFTVQAGQQHRSSLLLFFPTEEPTKDGTSKSPREPSSPTGPPSAAPKLSSSSALRFGFGAPKPAFGLEGTRPGCEESSPLYDPPMLVTKTVKGEAE